MGAAFVQDEIYKFKSTSSEGAEIILVLDPKPKFWNLKSLLKM